MLAQDHQQQQLSTPTSYTVSSSPSPASANPGHSPSYPYPHSLRINTNTACRPLSAYQYILYPSAVIPTANLTDTCTSQSTVYDLHTQPPTPLKRHPDLWFDDGSVVCRAKDVLFRVHKSMLSRHSICFKDMFSMPQPAEPDSDSDVEGNAVSEEGVGDGFQSSYMVLRVKKSRRKVIIGNGAEPDISTFLGGNGVVGLVAREVEEKIPVVDLQDEPDDVAHLLTALYDSPKFGDNGQEDFKVVSGILRLSTKYLIDSLRDLALDHLNEAWPNTLKGWDNREDLARMHETNSPDAGHLYPHPIAVINLAREVNAPQLLPSAFYDLCRYSFSQIFEPTEEDVLYSGNSLPTLSTYDMQCLCLGKEAAQHSITTLIRSMGNSHSMRQSSTHQSHATQYHHGHNGALSNHPPATASHANWGIGPGPSPPPPSHIRRSSGGGVCISAAACRKDFGELVDLATQHYLFDRERGYCDPLYVAEELGQLKSSEFSECKACSRALESWAAKERERLWKLIPSWFRLDGGGSNRSRGGSPRRF
ncbi:hypothetical protein AX16_003487 [Volvariella volvacea WC 439]|nr:hypothetical protein AX16_003487 [Volvariella volvacea WC 439]